ncbi:type IV pilus modification PilV family protein [Parahaliea aestuarii]|uniref:Prepilin-type N-terminal cleavage/methylation domain-containing protein n=1 Tax=Parahaliea aestuarii TaxID=1852021 RepID=A0A5C8ZKS0_9GAMM|nr:prepilin-type N-terminal cleavage/methylation domain-containing protein [Parahaliea aestuarii]TXS89028.1 prepilin-type N-terminal cleavage/methylation domain-containing protein [Parahaliea aestuarii]
MTNRQCGFSLIEVVLALGIFATAVLALGHSNEVRLQATAQLEKRSLAIIAASNTIESIRADSAVHPGVRESEQVIDGVAFRSSVAILETTHSHYFKVLVSVFDGATEIPANPVFQLQGGVYGHATSNK